MDQWRAYFYVEYHRFRYRIADVYSEMGVIAGLGFSRSDRKSHP